MVAAAVTNDGQRFRRKAISCGWHRWRGTVPQVHPEGGHEEEGPLLEAGPNDQPGPGPLLPPPLPLPRQLEQLPAHCRLQGFIHQNAMFCEHKTHFRHELKSQRGKFRKVSPSEGLPAPPRRHRITPSTVNTCGGLLDQIWPVYCHSSPGIAKMTKMSGAWPISRSMSNVGNKCKST